MLPVRGARGRVVGKARLGERLDPEGMTPLRVVTQIAKQCRGPTGAVDSQVGMRHAQLRLGLTQRGARDQTRVTPFARHAHCMSRGPQSQLVAAQPHLHGRRTNACQHTQGRCAAAPARKTLQCIGVPHRLRQLPERHPGPGPQLEQDHPFADIDAGPIVQLRTAACDGSIVLPRRRQPPCGEDCVRTRAKAIGQRG